MTIQEIIDSMNAATSGAEQVLKLIEGFDPGLELPVDIAAAVLPLVQQVVTAGLNAWSNASGRPITVETVTALLPNPDPLPPPSV